MSTQNSAKRYSRKWLSNKFKLLRRRHGRSQDRTAKLLGIKQKTYAAYEEARAEPDLDTLTKIAVLYGYTGIDDLLKSGSIPDDVGAKSTVMLQKYEQLPERDRQIVDLILNI